MNKTNFFRATAEGFKSGQWTVGGGEMPAAADAKNAEVAKERKGGRARTPAAPR